MHFRRSTCRCVSVSSARPAPASARPARRARDRGCRRRAAGARRSRCARSASSPSSIRARIRLKSVVPPPTSQTRISAPSAKVAGQLPAVRGDPGVERGQRLLEQRQLLEPRARSPPHRQLARFLVERRGHGEHDRAAARAARSSSVRRAGVVPGVAQVREQRAPTPRPATAAGRPRLPHGRSAAVRSTRGIRQPGLRRRDLPRRHERALVAREARRRRRPATASHGRPHRRPRRAAP